MKTAFVWLKLVLLSALITVTVFYTSEQKQGWYVLLFIGVAYWFANGMEKRVGQRTSVVLCVDKAGSYRWLQQNLSGNHIQDLKFTRRRFNLPLASAVKMLDKYLASRRLAD